MRSPVLIKHERELDNLGRMPTQRGGAFWPLSNATEESGVASGVLRYVMYIIVLIILILVVLVIVHFTIMPIFRTGPGKSGLIDLPGSDDSLWFFKTLQQNMLTVNELTPIPLGIPSSNYTYMLDINIDNPTVNPRPGKPRIIFARANGIPDYNKPNYTANSSVKDLFTDSTTITTIVYLDHLTNDLNIAVYTDGARGGAPITVTLPNVPVRVGFQLAVVIGSKFIEAYMNGRLVKTITFSSPPISLENGLLIPPSQELMNSTVRAMNLRIWRRVLSPAEIRGYTGNIHKFVQTPMMLTN
jgi:hypothetical protein